MTVGSNITQLTPSLGFVAQFSTSSIVMLLRVWDFPSLPPKRWLALFLVLDLHVALRHSIYRLFAVFSLVVYHFTSRCFIISWVLFSSQKHWYVLVVSYVIGDVHGHPEAIVELCERIGFCTKKRPCVFYWRSRSKRC